MKTWIALVTHSDDDYSSTVAVPVLAKTEKDVIDIIKRDPANEGYTDLQVMTLNEWLDEYLVE